MIYLHDIDGHYEVYSFDTLNYVAFDVHGVPMMSSDFDIYYEVEDVSQKFRNENMSFEEMCRKDLFSAIKKFLIVLGGENFTTVGFVNVSDFNEERHYNRKEAWEIYSSIVKSAMSGKCIKLSSFNNDKIFWKRSLNEDPGVFKITSMDMCLMKNEIASFNSKKEAD